MIESILFPESVNLRLNTISTEEKITIFTLTSTRTEAECPACSKPTSRIHSHYSRTIKDLPVAGQPVKLHVKVHKFMCTAIDCARKIFTERLPQICAPSARRTNRLTEALASIGLSLGGEAGMRTAKQLGIYTSADTMLRVVKNSATEKPVQPKIIGVDDWAWKKGRRYGTIIVDLERRKPIDLLPERSSESLATWLENHPGVEVISRDRAGTYADGASRGAPTAIQVADRWHLIGNLKDALGRLTLRCWSDLNKALTLTVISDRQGTDQPQIIVPPPGVLSTRREQLKQMTRDKRLARYNEVIELHLQGDSSREISRKVGLNRQTVLKYIHSGAFPEIAKSAPTPSLLDPFLSYLHERWKGGCHNGTRLFRELCARGYTGKRTIVSSYVARLRKSQPDAVLLKKPQAKHTLSWRALAWLIIKEDPSENERNDLEKIRQASSEIDRVHPIAQEFMEMVRKRKAKALDLWLEKAASSEVNELKTFAESLEKDKAAVMAALELPWSNGPVEGHIHRLKLLKRQMYGRAGFNLLRQRVIHRV